MSVVSSEGVLGEEKEIVVVVSRAMLGQKGVRGPSELVGACSSSTARPDKKTETQSNFFYNVDASKKALAPRANKIKYMWRVKDQTKKNESINQ
jgi:hypothetical protein